MIEYFYLKIQELDGDFFTFEIYSLVMMNSSENLVNMVILYI
jgi:hypothetical protein